MADEPFEDSADYVQSLARGLSVLRAFSRDLPTPSLSDVAVRTGLSRAVVRRSLMTLQHLGYVIPPQADSGWIGEAGPGDSYGDNGAGYDNDFTQRNTTFMAWNLMHLARLILMSASGQVPSQAKRRRIFRHRLAIGKQTLQSTFRIARSHLVLKLHLRCRISCTVLLGACLAL